MKTGKLLPTLLIALLIPAARAAAEADGSPVPRERVVLRELGARVPASSIPMGDAASPRIRALATSAPAAAYSVELSQVARLAGLPPPVVARAREILNGLERDELSRGGRPSLNAAASAGTQQLGLFQAPAPQDDPVLKRLREIDVNNITPVQALSILESLKREAGGT